MAVSNLADALSGLSIQDHTFISICCWNIMGSSAAGMAGYRKAVTTCTFSTTILGQADIICLQELTFHPTGRVAKEYFPFLYNDGYTCWFSCETEGQNKYNAIYFKNEKFFFGIPSQPVIGQAFALMDMKWKVYQTISHGGDEMKKQVEDGRATPWGSNNTEIRMCSEVFQECKKLGCNAAIQRYIAPGEMVTKSPRRLLSRRMAICYLQHRCIPNCRFVVVSLHNYSGRMGRGAPGNFVDLLLDFINKIGAPVLIAGDFNLDITSLLLPSYYSFIPYQPRPLRQGLCPSCIDFVIIKHYPTQWTFSLTNTEAHDLQVPIEVREKIADEKYITNHNPLSATLVVKQCTIL